MKRLVAIDLFCGAGGLSEGLHRAGFQVVAGFDTDPAMLKIYESRFTRRGAVAVKANLQRMSGAELMRKAGLSVRPAIICGGPPCQGFSSHRRGKGTDARNRLVLTFIRIALEIRPRAILLENVAGLAESSHNRTLRLVRRRLEAAGYRLHYKILDAADYGLPQRRKRLFLIAFREARKFAWPRKTLRRVTVADAIADLPRISPGQEYGATQYRRRRTGPYQRKLRGKCVTVHNHHAAQLSRRNRTRIGWLQRGDNWTDLPRRLLTPGMRRANKGAHTSRYGRLRWSQVSGTILTRFDDPKNGSYIHPVDERTLSVREAARLQGFPDGFRLSGNRGVQKRAVGNAVPPLLAETVARRVLKALRPKE